MLSKKLETLIESKLGKVIISQDESNQYFAISSATSDNRVWQLDLDTVILLY